MIANLSTAVGIMSDISVATTLDEAAACLDEANEYWKAGGDNADDILDAAMLLHEAVTLRIAGNIALAMKREAFLDRILSTYSF